MKKCPQCQQTFGDDTVFCLNDGNALTLVYQETEAATVIKSSNNSAAPPPNGVSPVFMYAAFGLLALFVGGAIIAALLFASNAFAPANRITETNINANQPQNSVVVVANQNSNKKDERADDLQAGRDALEREKQKLAAERKRLETEKKPVVDSVKTVTPARDAGTTRVNFGRGRLSETISGNIVAARRFVLRAKAGQQISASVGSPGGCVSFAGSATSYVSTTGAGDNFISLTNTCGAGSTFNLTVTIQ